jgi:hypothetical protein
MPLFRVISLVNSLPRLKGHLMTEQVNYICIEETRRGKEKNRELEENHRQAESLHKNTKEMKKASEAPVSKVPFI